jgi:alpha-glucosidase
MNLIGSHDTERFLTVAGGDRNLLKLAELIQFTWVGVPSVYYGDELGMEGGKDPQNRRGMRWDLATPQNDLLAWTRSLIRIRNSVPALQTGDPSILLADDATRTLAYARAAGPSDVSVVVALNRDSTTHTISVPIPKGSAFAGVQRLGFVDALSGRRFAVPESKVSIPLGGLEGVILLPADPAALHLAADAKRLASAISVNDLRHLGGDL